MFRHGIPYHRVLVQDGMCHVLGGERTFGGQNSRFSLGTKKNQSLYSVCRPTIGGPNSSISKKANTWAKSEKKNWATTASELEKLKHRMASCKGSHNHFKPPSRLWNPLANGNFQSKQRTQLRNGRASKNDGVHVPWLGTNFSVWVIYAGVAHFAFCQGCNIRM